MEAIEFAITFDICKCDMSMLTLEFSTIQDGRIAWREDSSTFTEGHRRALGSKSAVDVHPEEAKMAKNFLSRTVLLIAATFTIF